MQVNPSCRRKRIIFLRHGESEWNEVQYTAVWGGGGGGGDGGGGGGDGGGGAWGECLFQVVLSNISCVGGGGALVVAGALRKGGSLVALAG